MAVGGEIPLAPPGETAARPRRPGRGGRIARGAAWALLYAAIIAGILLQRSPLRVGPPAVPMRGGSGFPEARPDAPALLVLPPSPASRGPERFSTLPTAGGWGNLMLQEFGSLRVVPAAALDTLDLDRLGLIVLPEGCRPPDDGPLGQRLARFVEGGGVVLCERSWPKFRAGAGTDKAGATTVGWIAPGLADTALAGALGRLTVAVPADHPLQDLCDQGRGPATPIPLVRAAAARGGAEGRLLVAAIRQGAGGWLCVDLPLARQLVTWQQGQPADDFRIPLRHRREAGVPFCQPNALVPDARLLETLYPHADAWERLIAACVESVRPVPRLWYFPYAYDGAWAMTHDDESSGDLATWMTREEKRQGAVSTIFIVPGQRITAKGVAAMTADGTDLALHWWRGWSGDVTRPLGLFGWRPLRRVQSLTWQCDRMQALGAPQADGSSRVHGLIWDAHWTRDFRRLDAAGFHLDSTYGPSGPEQLAYEFGTGFPFHPLDTDGRPFRLLEVPFLYQDDENWRPDLDETLLCDSAASLHELLVPLYHVTTMGWRPSAAIMDGYLAAFDRARAHDHWITSLEGYRRFWMGRASAPLRRDAAGGYRVAAASPDRAPAEDLAVMVPPGARLLAADGSEPPGRTVELMGRAYRLVPVSALGGRFTLEARP